MEQPSWLLTEEQEQEVVGSHQVLEPTRSQPLVIQCKMADGQTIIYTSWDDIMMTSCAATFCSQREPRRFNAGMIISLDCSNNQLTSLPESIGNLTQLQKLCCNMNKLISLPKSIENLTQLQHLSCNSNQLTTLPDSITNLTQLKELYCGDNNFTTLPESIGNLTQLQVLCCHLNQLKSLPESIGNLTQLHTILCGENQLTLLPEWIGNLTQLKILYCQLNQLKSLPESMGNLTQLHTFVCAENQLTSLPESIGNLTQLQTLYCHSNQLTSLPEWIGKLTQLRLMSCSSNQLRTLPIQLIECRRLEYLKIQDNPIEVIPLPLQRMIDRMRDYRIRTGIYTDRQNVHSSSIQASVKQSIYNLLNDRSIPDLSDDQLRELIVRLPSDLLSDETKSALFEYMGSTEEHSTLNITFGDLLKKVIGRIEKNDGKVRKDLYQRLNEEMADSECKCFTGRLSRLVNVLVGFFDDIRIEISGAEQISVVIALVKTRHNIGDEDEVTPEAKAEIRTELEARGYEPGVIEEWLAALE